MFLKKPKNHRHLIEKIRNKTISPGQHDWPVSLTWIQSHAGQIGNELADILANQATGKKTYHLAGFPNVT